MKIAIPITLIICGTLLVALPVISDYLHTLASADLLQQLAGTSSRVTLAGRLSEAYRLGCYFAGCGMVATGVSMAWAWAGSEGKSSHGVVSYDGA